MSWSTAWFLLYAHLTIARIQLFPNFTYIIKSLVLPLSILCCKQIEKRIERKSRKLREQISINLEPKNILKERESFESMRNLNLYLFMGSRNLRGQYRVIIIVSMRKAILIPSQGSMNWSNTYNVNEVKCVLGRTHFLPFPAHI